MAKLYPDGFHPANQPLSMTDQLLAEIFRLNEELAKFKFFETSTESGKNLYYKDE